MKEFVGLRAKTNCCLKENIKKYIMKRKLRFEVYKNWIDEAQIENKIKRLEKNKIDVDSSKEFIKKKNWINKTQQTFESEEINKIALSSNDDRRMQTIDLIETCAHGMNKDLLFKKEEIKCNNIIK